jgi:hypothetical protein
MTQTEDNQDQSSLQWVNEQCSSDSTPPRTALQSSQKPQFRMTRTAAELLELIRRYPVLILSGFWTGLMLVAMMSTLALMSPQLAERQDPPRSSLPTITAPTSPVISTPILTPDQTRSLPVFSLLAIVLGGWVGSSMIAQRLRPPPRMLRSTSRSSSRRVASTSGSSVLPTSASSNFEVQPDVDKSLHPHQVWPDTDDSVNYDHPATLPTMPPELVIREKLEHSPRPASSPPPINLEDFDLRRQRSLIFWNERSEP